MSRKIGKKPNWTGNVNPVTVKSITIWTRPANRLFQRITWKSLSIHRWSLLHSASFLYTFGFITFDAPVPDQLNNPPLSWYKDFAQDQYQWPAHPAQQKISGMILVILRLSLRCTVNIKHLNLLAEKHLVIGPDMQTRAHAYDWACSCTLYPPGKYPRVNRSLIQNQFQSIKHNCDIFSCEKFTINCPYSTRKKKNE
jgi:hypothetical protein